MVGRLWFSLCALAALLVFALGVIVAGSGWVEPMLRDRPTEWGFILAGTAIAFAGPLLCRGIYRWGLWVAGVRA